MAEEHKNYFYDRPILRNQEQAYINSLLKKYKNLPANEELKQKIWEELQQEKSLGKITIPFKIALRKDPSKKFPDFIEIILDTKV
jgi:hypothetical protein